MNILKSTILGALLVLSITHAYAAKDDNALAIEYLTLSKAKETFEKTIDAYVAKFSSQTPNADKESIKQFFNTYMGWDALKDPTVEIVKESLSKKELKDIIRFYKTDSGRSLAEKSPKMSANISNLIGLNLQKAIQEIQNPQAK